MPRGQASPVGTTRVAKNGYEYTKVADRGWVLSHWLVAEEKLGRELHADESVRFNDGNRKNMAPHNLRVVKKKTVHLRTRLEVVEAKIERYEDERREILKQLGE